MRDDAPRLTLTRDVPPPHGGAAVFMIGAPLERARGAMILTHGRGGSADDILALSDQWPNTGLTFVAPQAADDTWYPESFLAPLARNEPHLPSALALLAAIVDELSDRGIPHERQMLLGFSQGGCLALEFSGRNARRRGGIIALSGGLIGPPGHAWAFTGSLDGTPVFLGCSDVDPHIPRERVEESAAELTRIGGQVEMRIYPGLGHTVNRDELSRVQGMIDRMR